MHLDYGENEYHELKPKPRTTRDFLSFRLQSDAFLLQQQNLRRL